MSLPAALQPPPAPRHPQDLPTSDPSLATEIMPAPPPLSLITNPSHHHGGPRLPILTRSGANRYMPAVDLGTTYTGHGALPLGAGSLELPPQTQVMVEGAQDGGAKPKRATRGAALGPNAKSTAVNRVQRSTRSRPSTDSPAPGPGAYSSPPVSSAAAGPSQLPPTAQAPPGANGEGEDGAERPAKRQKLDVRGKGKERERDGREGGEPMQTNKDYCETCGGIGEFICCDGCTRSYHFLCLNPPVEMDDIPADKWFCGVCLYNKKPHAKPTNRFLGVLTQQVESDSPKIFKLPDSIREYFKSVSTGPSGEYVQQGQARGGRLNKYGAVEERDPFRLKDKNGKPVLCYKCKAPALPETLPEGARAKTRSAANKGPPRPIISCDFCAQHWHYDCLDPPLIHPPANWKKWQCPLHVEHVFPMKRIPAKGVKTVDVKQRNRPNNGIIDVVFGEEDLSSMKVENVVINGKRYRVPEKTIILDFWDALQGKRPDPATTESLRTSEAPTDILSPLPDPPLMRTGGVLSAFSSPLSSLSSLSSIPEEEISSDPLSDPMDEDVLLPPPILRPSPIIKPSSRTSPMPVYHAPEPSDSDVRDAAEILASFAWTAGPPAAISNSLGLGISHGTPTPQAVNERPTTPSPPHPASTERPKTPSPPHAVKVNGSPALMGKPIGQPDAVDGSPYVLSAAREQLKKDVQLAMSQGSRPASPKVPPSAPSSPQPKPSITVKQKEDGSFTLKLPSLKRTLSHQNNAATTPSKPTPKVEDVPASLTPEETERLLAVKRLMQAKGEAELMKFLMS